MFGMQSGEEQESQKWRDLLSLAAAQYGTPCYVARWRPVEVALASLVRLSPRTVPIRSWLSFKTHPVLPLVQQWLDAGHGVEVVSECELVTALGAGADVDHLLVNGVAKHAWLPRHHVRGLRVHFDSIGELQSLTAQARDERWRVGIRCHVPDEHDAREPGFGGQFGMSTDEAVNALRLLRVAGVDPEGLHFHLGSAAHIPGAYQRAIEHLHRICLRAAFRPRYIDLGGGLPANTAAGSECWRSLEDGLAAAAAMFSPELEELWLENGRYMTGRSTALIVRVLDVKDREDSRYLICDGGRTNQALAADHGAHPLLIMPERSGSERLTAICGPTCMTDDLLARVPLPQDVGPGDLIAWMDAGAYHLPWETRFSHGRCAVVWADARDRLTLARERERPATWADAWNGSAACP